MSVSWTFPCKNLSSFSLHVSLFLSLFPLSLNFSLSLPGLLPIMSLLIYPFSFFIFGWASFDSGLLFPRGKPQSSSYRMSSTSRVLFLFCPEALLASLTPVLLVVKSGIADSRLKADVGFGEVDTIEIRGTRREPGHQVLWSKSFCQKITQVESLEIWGLPIVFFEFQMRCT